MDELLASSDPLTKKTAESFMNAFKIVRQKTDGTDSLFIQAREKYLQL